MDRLSGGRIFFILLTGTLFFMAYLPAFEILVEKWQNSEEYNHAFLTLPLLVYMVWRKKDELAKTTPCCCGVGLLLVLLSTASYLFSLLTQVPTFISLSLYFTLAGLLVFLGGLQAVRLLFTPLVLLLILIPVPEQLYIKVTFPLQLKVSQVSEFLLELSGVPILREGNVMHAPGKSFEVVEACSGMRSIITLFTLSLIMGYFMLKTRVAKIILLMSSIPIAIAVNIVRVSSMILLYHFFQLDLSEGFLHTATGLLVFVLAFAMLLLVHRILEYGEMR